MIVGQIVVQSALSSSQSDSVRVNLAGRQRMLSVSLVSQAAELHYEDLNETRAESIRASLIESMGLLDETHRGLQFGDPLIGLDLQANAAEADVLKRLRPSLDAMLATASKIARHDRGRSDRGAGDASQSAAKDLRDLRVAQEQFLPLMDRLVYRMSAEATDRIQYSKWIETVLFVTTLLVLALEALFVFRPATDAIRRTITLLRERERLLRQSERRHRDLVRYSADPIVSLNPDSGRIVDINPAAASDLGETAEHLIGKRFQLFLNADSSELLGDQLNVVQKADQTECQLELIERDGVRRRWMTRLTHYQRDQNESTVLLTARDMNDQLDREQRLMEANQRDGLTGLLNRREFDIRIAAMAANHQRQGIPFALGLIDIDHFKQINDGVGHQAGDEILRQLSRLVEQACRGADLIARYGGEEIAILLPSLTSAQASTIASRVRQMLQDAELSVTNKFGKAEIIKVTASIGIAAAPEHGLVPEKLIQMADAALYAAKKAGRNQVVVASVASTNVSSLLQPNDGSTPMGLSANAALPGTPMPVSLGGGSSV